MGALDGLYKGNQETRAAEKHTVDVKSQRLTNEQAEFTLNKMKADETMNRVILRHQAVTSQLSTEALRNNPEGYQGALMAVWASDIAKIDDAETKKKFDRLNQYVSSVQQASTISSASATQQMGKLNKLFFEEFGETLYQWTPHIKEGQPITQEMATGLNSTRAMTEGGLSYLDALAKEKQKAVIAGDKAELLEQGKDRRTDRKIQAKKDAAALIPAATGGTTDLGREEKRLEGLEEELLLDPDNKALEEEVKRARASVNKKSGVIAGGATKGRIATSRQAINNVTVLLDEGDSMGSIAGISGALKSSLGGLARQFGIPVTTQSRSLDVALEVIQASLTPVLLNEKRVTDTERKRVQKIVGELSALTDEVLIRSRMAELSIILDNIESRGSDDEAAKGNVLRFDKDGYLID